MGFPNCEGALEVTHIPVLALGHLPIHSSPWCCRGSWIINTHILLGNGGTRRGLNFGAERKSSCHLKSCLWGWSVGESVKSQKWEMDVRVHSGECMGKSSECTEGEGDMGLLSLEGYEGLQHVGLLLQNFYPPLHCIPSVCFVFYRFLLVAFPPLPSFCLVCIRILQHLPEHICLAPT